MKNISIFRDKRDTEKKKLIIFNGFFSRKISH